jgi:hypothetical protein
MGNNQVACQYRNEFTCAGIQHEARDEYHGQCGIDESDGGVRPAALLCVEVV